MGMPEWQATLESIGSNAVDALESIGQSPFLGVELGAQTIGSLLALKGLSSSLAKTMNKVLTIVGKKALGSKGNLAITSGLSFGANMGDLSASAVEAFDSIPDEELQQTPEYQQAYTYFISTGVPEEQAKKASRNYVTDKGLRTAQAVGLLPMLFGSKLEGKFVNNNVLSGAIKNSAKQQTAGSIIKNFLKETGTGVLSEGITEGTVGFGSNYAIQQHVDPNKSI